VVPAEGIDQNSTQKIIGMNKATACQNRSFPKTSRNERNELDREVALWWGGLQYPVLADDILS
jgi:hypothetical protein